MFTVRELRNLVMVDEMESLSPVMDCKVANLSDDDTPQFYTACGRGPRSTFRILRHGLEVSEMAVSELPGNPNAIWTVKHNANGAAMLCMQSGLVLCVMVGLCVCVSMYVLCV